MIDSGKYIGLKQALPSGADLAKDIRARIADLNDLILLAALQEIDVAFDLRPLDNHPRSHTLTVYVSQEV